MTDYFPTDVSLRIEGNDLEAAQSLIPSAANLLYKALALQGRGLPIVRLIRPGDDGSLIHVFLSGAIKQVYVRPAVPVSVPVHHPLPEHKPTVPSVVLYILCGMVDSNGDLVLVEGEPAVHRFKPTDATADSHADEVEPDWHDNVRLADATDWLHVKASMFSGGMKRVVQAVMGLGTITDDSGFYLTPPDDETRQIPMAYRWEWGRTHGVYTNPTGDKWLIEISADNGVLAMPLPLIPSTTYANYVEVLRAIGDTGSMGVAIEFGGLPSGETFPADPTDLETAITAGTVLRLLTATDMEAFYDDAIKSVDGITGICGWAFSETGNVVHNTRLLRGGSPATVESEHWSITLTLSNYDFSAPARGQPIGTGSASLSMVSTGKLSNEALLGVYRAGGTFSDQLLQPGPIGGPPTDDLPTYYGSPSDADPEHATGATHAGWGATVYVFFIDDELQVVQWVPWFLSVYGQVADLEDEPPDAAYPSLGTLVADFMAQWFDVKIQRSIHVDPQCFVCSAVNLRREFIYEAITWLSGTPGGEALLPTLYVIGTRTSSTPPLPGTTASLVTGIPPVDSVTDFGDNLPQVEITRASNEYGNGGPLTADRHQDDRYVMLLPQFCREAAIFGRFAFGSIPGYVMRGVASGLGVFDVTSTDELFDVTVVGNNIHFGLNVNAGSSRAYVKTGVFWPGAVWSPIPDPFPYDKVNVLEGLADDAVPANMNFVGNYDQ